MKIEDLKTKAELREAAESMVKDFNGAVLTGDFAKSNALDSDIEQVVNKYTSISREECFNALKATENPMIEACKQLTFATIRVKDTKQGEDKTPVRIIEDTDKYIDLLKLHKHIDGGIGANKNWHYMLERMNYLMTARVSKELGINAAEVKKNLEEYACSENSKSVDIGKDCNSNTTLLRAMTVCVAAMVGEEYKPLSHDVNFLLHCYTKKSKAALSVNCANHRYFRQYIMEICHRIICGEVYTVDFKRKKKA